MLHLNSSDFHGKLLLLLLLLLLFVKIPVFNANRIKTDQTQCLICVNIVCQCFNGTLGINLLILL